MPIVIHTDIKQNLCIPDLKCDGSQTLEADWSNKLKTNTEGLAAHGKVVSSGNSGYRHGRFVPFNGFAVNEVRKASRGNGSKGNIFRDLYVTRQESMITDLYTHFVLQIEVKLFEKVINSAIQRISPCDITLEPVGGGSSQRLVRIVGNNFTAGPGEYSIPYMTPTTIRVSGPINPTLRPQPGQAVAVDVVTSLTHNSGNTVGVVGVQQGFSAQNKYFNNFWAGIRSYSLYFYTKC